MKLKLDEDEQEEEDSSIRGITYYLNSPV